METSSQISLVTKLSKEYNFDLEDALKKLSLNTHSNSDSSHYIGKSSIVLPWCGYVCKESCKGLKLYHKLFIQCKHPPSKDSKYCTSCLKNNCKYGTVDDRLKVGALDYIDPRGIRVLPYANVMEKLNISRDMVVKQAQKLGLEIDDAQFIKSVSKRGRPKKQVVNVSDTDSESSEVIKPIKKRGRPKKEKKEVNIDVAAETMKTLFNMEKIKNDECEEITVTKKIINNKPYLISISNNRLFDIKTHELVGYWNECTEQIED